MNHLDKLKIIENQYSSERDYWYSKLLGVEEKCHFPYDITGNDSQKSELVFTINGDLNTQLIRLSNKSDYKLHVILSSVIGILLNKYANYEDIIIGTPIFRQEEKENFINTILPLRIGIADDKTFKELLIETNSTLLEAVKNQNYPLEVLAKAIDADYKDKSKDLYPLFDIIMLLTNIQDKEYINHIKTTIVFQFTRHADFIEGKVEYDKAKYHAENIKYITNRFILIVQQIIQSIDAKISHIQIFSAEDKVLILQKFNNTSTDIPASATYIELFEEQVKKFKNRVALVYNGQSMSYRDLNIQSTYLAAILRENGLQNEELVGIHLERSSDFVVAVLGIWKAGGSYLPIDPEYPNERKEFIQNDSKIKLLITNDKNKESIDNQCKKILINQLNYTGNIPETKGDDISKAGLAYIIYTSGTTGQPKGVMVDHSALINHCFWHNSNFGITEDDIATQYANICFDASIWEIFPYLIKGAAVHFIPEELKLDISALHRYYEKNNISISFLPTPICEKFIDEDNKSLRILLTGGDKLKKYKQNSFELYNNYGPTENTVVTTSFKVTSSSPNIPIGKPVSNNRIFILNEKTMALQPVGVYGELCIAGNSLAKGYLNNPLQTAQKFISIDINGVNELIYRTGDIVRWLPDGNIEFLGRNDSQTKIRGYRIEIGEVESHLLGHPDIDEVVVDVKEDLSLNKNIYAYYVSKKDFPQNELKAFLSKSLPHYMIPAHFIRLDAMPLTLNGKLDKKALPSPVFNLENVYVAPKNKIEQELVDIWSKELQIAPEKISTNSSFFSLGGHSLSVITLLSRIHKAFNVKLSLADFFESPNILALAELINFANKDQYIKINAAEECDYYPLTHTQRSLFIHSLKFPNDISHNMPFACEVNFQVDSDKLENAFIKTIERHESLRTSFKIINNIPVQVVNQQFDFEISGINCTEDDISEAFKQFVRPFDLSLIPLIRVQIANISATKTVLFGDIPHLISDPVSINNLISDLLAIYNNLVLPELSLQYKDFAVFMNQENALKNLNAQTNYWINQLSGNLPQISIHRDYEAEGPNDFVGEKIEFTINESYVQKLNKISEDEGVSAYILIFAIYFILINKISGEEDIIIATTADGRKDEELTKIVGLFINTLPIRNFPEKNKRFIDFLKEVKENILTALDNQEFIIDEIISKIQVNRNPNHHPITDFSFGYRQMSNNLSNDLPIKMIDIVVPTVKNDLSLFCNNYGSELQLEFIYAVSLFKRETIERFIELFLEVTYCVCDKKEITISDIKVSSQYKQIQEAIKEEDFLGFNF